MPDLEPNEITAVVLPTNAPTVGATPPPANDVIVLPVPGAPGIQGDEGPSAYDVAVANGFVGTENEWLSSLIGAGVDLSAMATKTFVEVAVQSHVEAEEPHPVYDNMMDLSVLFKNRLV